MLRINQLKIKPERGEKDLDRILKSEIKDNLLKTLHLKPEELLEYHIFRRSIDARKKPDIFYSYTIDFCTKHEKKLLAKYKNRLQSITPVNYKPPVHGKLPLSLRPVITGAGPAGLFCAYLLALEGYHPILLERGAAVEQRRRDVEKFWESGVLDPASNVQFGEGGAGTFSDGKLNTMVKEQCGRNRFVLETFVKFGAPESILYEQKPHIGTDILFEVVHGMREEIIRLGGEVRFHAQVTDIEEMEEIEEMDTPASKKRQVKCAIVNNEERLYTRILVLAIGHSARDTFDLLHCHDLPMESKSFAVGVRIEHPQEMIQIAQYGSKMADKLPPASYKLTHTLENGRGVYTFCMCPGGYVVNASSEEGRLCVNGMSNSRRDGENANSAVIVTVTPDDFGSDSALAGVAFQRKLEEKAYEIGNGKIPVQRFDDFCRDVPSKSPGDILPQTKGTYHFANVRSIFPSEIGDSLEQGIRAMDKKIEGFARPDAMLAGVESRTSSPVRILRDENFESAVRGIYPCGEGAGYAGGITSAAMDGMKVAEAIIAKYVPIFPDAKS